MNITTLPPRNIQLTNREFEILKLISEENTNREIAEKLFVSPHTVNTFRKNLLNKLAVRNTAGLIIKSLRLGLLQL